MQALLPAAVGQTQGGVLAQAPDAGDELRWVELARAADPRAFENLYRANVDRIYGLCLRMTGNVAEAEDCVQEAFIQAWNKLDKFRGDSAFGTWLHRVAVNVVLGRMRKSRRGSAFPCGIFPIARSRGRIAYGPTASRARCQVLLARAPLWARRRETN